MLDKLKAKFNNWLASDRKIKKLFVSLHYYLFRHRMWARVLSLDTKNKFTEIYTYNLWNNEESRSGGGSTLKRTAKIRDGLRRLFAEEEIRSICDAGCGDFNWMKAIQMDGIRYIGVDIVSNLIVQNKKSYEGQNVSFEELDIIHEDLPTVDLILCREVLFHLSFQDMCEAIGNFKRSKSKYLLTTHYPYISSNVDIETGKCRAVNFQLAPMNFSAPLRTIEEDVSDHCLALWKLDDIDPDKFGNEVRCS